MKKIIAIFLILSCFTFSACDLFGSSDSSLPTDKEGEIIEHELSELILNNLSEENRERISEGDFGIFVVYYSGSYEIAVTVNERKDIAPVAEQAIATILGFISLDSAEQSEIVIKSAVDESDKSVTRFKLTTATGYGAIEKIVNGNVTVIKENVPYDSISNYINSKSGNFLVDEPTTEL